MNSPFTSLDFERFIYRQGQLLASRDFRDQQRMEAARQWMHNSAAHNVWGIALGYELSSSGSNLDRWEANETLTISPGIAYDCFGRELILARETKFDRSIFEDDLGNLRDDLTGRTFFLVLTYKETAVKPTGDSCSGSPNSVVFPQPLFVWKPKNEVIYGPDVPLLYVSFTNVASVRRFTANRARPQARPKIASGRTVAGQTAWQNWEVLVSPPVTVGLQVKIDTREAGFQQTPCYFAWLNGSLQAIIDGRIAMVAPFISLADENPDSFTFRVLMLESRQLQIPVRRINPTIANQHKVTVCWLGIEHDGSISHP
jgi:hypothetical protein